MNCKFAAPRTDAQGVAAGILCRRYPPRVFAQFFLVPAPRAPEGQPAGPPQPLEMVNTYWPSVQPTDCCGEHVTALVVAASLRRS